MGTFTCPPALCSSLAAAAKSSYLPPVQDLQACPASQSRSASGQTGAHRWVHAIAATQYSAARYRDGGRAARATRHGQRRTSLRILVLQCCASLLGCGTGPGPGQQTANINIKRKPMHPAGAPEGTQCNASAHPMYTLSIFTWEHSLASFRLSGEWGAATTGSNLLTSNLQAQHTFKQLTQ